MPEKDGGLKISFKEYCDMRFGFIEQRAEESNTVAAKAVDKAEESLGRRLDIMNEFRRTIDDQTKTFLPQAEYDAAHTRVVDDIKEIRAALGERLTRKEWEEFMKQYATVKTDIDIAKGKASQNSVYIGYFFSGVALLLSIIMFLIKILEK